MVSEFETKQKNMIFYVGISMVCMITLQKRAGHEIAAFDSTRPSHLIPCRPRTLLQHNNHSNITSAEGYPSRRGWENGSTPKKPSPHLHGPSPTSIPKIEDIKITTFDKEVSIPPKVLNTMAVSLPLLPPSILC
jgi:hypothetical protein